MLFSILIRVNLCSNLCGVLDLRMRFVGVIPVRFESSRLPGKPLVEIAGRPIIWWVHEQVCQAKHLSEVLVATDSERVFETVKDFGGKAVMTGTEHHCGTDRIGEVAQSFEGEVFVNIQGDLPAIAPQTIDQICAPFEKGSQVQVTTARVQITDLVQIQNPNIVKVVVDNRNRALYFSRSIIPHSRDGSTVCYKHVGVYAYKRHSLQMFCRLKPSRLERIEGLEQLRFLENGVPIEVIEVDDNSPAVDVPEDIKVVSPLLENEFNKSG